MNLINRAASTLALALALTAVAGCSDKNVALVGRDTLPSWENQPLQDELTATIERINTASREIDLRPKNGRIKVVGYSTDARVLYRGREYPVTKLEFGDVVAMQLMQDPRGKPYTDLIRVQESIRDRNQNLSATNRPESGMQTVDGRVEQINLQRSSFEIRDQFRETVFVSLPDNAQRPDVDRFRALRSGDYVRVEGRFLDRERFELDGFLRDNR